MCYNLVMKRVLDKETRERLKDTSRSIRRAAREENVSPTTVQKWRAREGVESRSINENILPAYKTLFAELIRLSRYRYQYLRNYLAPKWPIMNKKNLYVSDMTFKRFLGDQTAMSLTSEDGKSNRNICLLKHFCKPSPGSIAVHKITARLKVVWDVRLKVKDKDPSGGYREIEILILMERFSGLIYAKAFRKIDEGIFLRALSSFSQMLPYKARKINFVTSLPPSEYVEDLKENDAVTTVLNVKIHEDKVRFHNRILGLLGKTIPSQPQFSYDPLTPNIDFRLKIPLLDKDANSYIYLPTLNEDIEKLLNALNTDKRERSYRGKTYDISPISLLLDHSLMKKNDPISPYALREKYAKKILLPRNFRHEFVELT